MSTDTDGAAPSVASSADAEPDSPGDGSTAPGDGTTGAWLQAEIRRRMAANAGGSGGRHARRDAGPVASRPDYVPRHAGGIAQAGPVAAAEAAAPHPAAPPASPPGAALPPAAPAADRVAPPHPAPAPPEVPPLGGPSLPPEPLPARRGRPRVPPPARSPDPGAAAPGGLFTPPAGSPRPAPDRPRPDRFRLEPPAPDRREPVPDRPGSAGPVPRPAPAGAADPATGDTVLWSRPADAPPLPGPAPRPAGPPPGPATRPPDPSGGAGPPTGPDGPPTGGDLRRVRVVLSERKGVAKPVRTIRQVQEDDEVGELLRRNLIGSQLTVALRFAVFAAVTLGLLPVLFAVFPEIGRAELLGLRVPWLLLGIAVYPFLLVLGWWHARTAERVEQNFAEHVQD